MFVAQLLASTNEKRTKKKRRCNQQTHKNAYIFCVFSIIWIFSCVKITIKSCIFFWTIPTEYSKTYGISFLLLLLLSLLLLLLFRLLFLSLSLSLTLFEKISLPFQSKRTTQMHNINIMCMCPHTYIRVLCYFVAIWFFSLFFCALIHLCISMVSCMQCATICFIWTEECPFGMHWFLIFFCFRFFLFSFLFFLFNKEKKNERNLSLSFTHSYHMLSYAEFLCIMNVCETLVSVSIFKCTHEIHLLLPACLYSTTSSLKTHFFSLLLLLSWFTFFFYFCYIFTISVCTLFISTFC